jgi:hypothetical protein
MRASHPLVPAAVALLAGALAAPPATGQASSDAKAGAGGTRSTTAGTQSRTQTRASQSRPAKRRVWTNADLVALRNDPSAQVLVLESKRLGGPAPKVRMKPSVKPQDVVDRYAALAREAETKLAELDRERLAASNPYLRGLASKTGGPRSPAQIEADRQRWTSRRDTARSNLERAQKLTGARPTEPAAR